MERRHIPVLLLCLCELIQMVYMVSGVIQMLICKTHRYWEYQQQQQQRRLCRQILLPRPRRLRPRDPWAMQLKLQQTGEGAGESPAPQNWAHSAKETHPYRKAFRSRGTTRLTLQQAGNLSRGQQNTRKILKKKKRTDTQHIYSRTIYL